MNYYLKLRKTNNSLAPTFMSGGRSTIRFRALAQNQQFLSKVKSGLTRSSHDLKVVAMKDNPLRNISYYIQQTKKGDHL